jgi:DNA-binding CsgD family transcriptional regulator
MTDAGYGQGRTAGALVVLAVVLLLVGWDLVEDYRSGTALLHLSTELGVFLVAIVGTGLLLRRFLTLQAEARLLARDLDAARREARRWREETREYLDGLGVSIDNQFQRWKLTPAEAEVGLLILKGLSHKEIAQVRETSERTVRQQARALYLKAGLAGRSELSAFFLEDLLLPRSAGDSAS